MGASFGSWIKKRGILNWFEESFPYFSFVRGVLSVMLIFD